MKAQAEKVRKKAEEQPLFLKELLNAINWARRQASLYGNEHKTSAESVQNLRKAIMSMIRRLGSCTMVITRERLIVNDRSYIASGDGRDLCHRLRARGAMGISFVDNPLPEEVAKLIHLLNAEPSDVREAGGPCAYLKQLGVGSILATDAIYTAGGGNFDNNAEPLSEDDIDPALLDPAVRALIERTCSEGGGKDLVEVPLSDILSSSDATAKLIWESVIKLHSTSSQPVGELGFQVIHNLKGMAAKKKEVWDLTTLQVRKAIAKLPDEIRSTAFGFLTKTPPSETPADVKCESPEEDAAADSLDLGPNMKPMPNSDAEGPLESWQKELQADTVLKCSGRTMATLMAWESDPIEHGRLARVLASMIPHGLSDQDVEGALMLVESLLKECGLTDAPSWRVENAQSALQSLDMHTLRSLVESALESEISLQVIPRLIDAVPSLSLVLTDFLKTGEHRIVVKAIKRSLVKSGSESTSVLRDLLKDESPIARQAALEILIQIGAEPAIYAISCAMETADDAFLTRALGMLPSIRTNSVTRTCAQYVGHKSLQVRICALRALGALGDQLAMGILIEAATKRTRDLDEQITAIHSLGEIKHPDTAMCLKSIADRRSFLWRSRSKRLRMAAEEALSRGGRCRS